MLGSDMLQSQRMLIKGKFSEKPTPEFFVSICSWGRWASESVVKEWHASININLTQYV